MPEHALQKVRKIAVALLCMLVLSGGVFSVAFGSSVENVQVMSAPLTVRSNATNGMVRVYLSSLGNPSTLDLTVVGNYSINGNTNQSISSGSSLTVGFSSSTGAITLTHNGTKTNMGTFFTLRRHSASGVNGIKIRQARESNNPYPGDLSFRAVSNGGSYKLYTIAHIYIENYLYGVLPYEMGNSTNLEALKAQAVAARTYTVRMMESRASSNYDVVDTTSDQVYRGTPSGNANCVAAVDGTKGIVLMNGSSYTATYYSASNGGQTESIKNAWGTNGYNYMVVKDDPFDLANPSSTVKRTTLNANLSSGSNHAALMNLLQSKVVSKLKSSGYGNANASNTTLQTLKSVTPHSPKFAAPSRLYQKMDFTIVASVNGSQATVTVTCGIFDELESMLSMGIQSSKNELWSVKKSGTSFTLEARRFGHGLGLSQRGAMHMAKLGYTYDQILGFYYNQCKRVRHSFTNTILTESGDTQTTIEDPAELGEDTSSACKGTVKLLNASAALAIRKGKDIGSELIGTASNGAILDVLATDGTWCFVRFGNVKGYVPANALQITGTPTGSEENASTLLGFATVTANDFVNLREEASTSARVISTAPAGAVLTVLSQSGSWAYVQYNATVAYVNAGYISAVSTTYPSKVVSTGSATATVATEDGTGFVNLRASASTDAEVLMTLPQGTQVTITSDDGSWCMVTYNGVSGYLLSEFLTYSGDSLDHNESGGTGGDPPDQKPDGGGGDGSVPVNKAVVNTASGSLNMRTEAKAGSRILTTIPRGAEVEVTEIGNTWCGVNYGGLSGYVMTSFLAFTPGGEQPKPPTPENSGSAVVTTQSGSLNLREQGRAGSTILRTIPQYATVAVLERGAQWCKVNYQETVGYVMTVFLTFADESTGTPPPATPAPSLTPTPDGGAGGGEGDVNNPDVPITPDPGTDDTLYATVTTVSGSLNLRSDALPGSNVIGRIPKGATIIITQQLAAWSQTTYGGQQGYVMNAYLTFRQGKPQEEAEGDTAVVNTASGSLNLRTEPSRSAGVIASIPQYATVSVQQRGAAWCAIGYQGYFGYVMTEFLSFRENTPAPTGSISPNPTLTPELPKVEGTPQPTVTNEPQATPPALQTAYVATASGSLNLRVRAEGNSPIITKMPQGAAVSVLNHGQQWCLVRYDGLDGYAMTEFLRFDGTAPVLPSNPQTAVPVPKPDPTPEQGGTGSSEPSGETVFDITLAAPASQTLAVVIPKANENALTLWSECSENSKAVISVPQQEQVEVILQGVTWCLVQYGSEQGYCLTRNLNLWIV
ncbi:MAG: SH3 domain-containing protein [Clostridia bacterium]